jgi:hypothetical protein
MYKHYKNNTWYIDIIIVLLDIIQSLFKKKAIQRLHSACLLVEPTQLGPIDRASPYVWR